MDSGLAGLRPCAAYVLFRRLVGLALVAFSASSGVAADVWLPTK
jgi:hypothetical protein